MQILLKSTFLRLSVSVLFVSSTLPTFANQNNQTYATQINTDNAAQLIRQGPDAIGGIGDWFFTNGVLCAIVSDIKHESEFSTTGGSLVDLGFCGRADDHFSFTHDLLQGSRKRPLDSYKIAIENNDESSSIVVNGHRDGVEIETRYTLEQANPTQMRIDKRLSQKAGAKDFNFFSPLIFNLRSLEPFVLNRSQIELNNGFQAQEFASRGVSAMDVSARDADTIITVSPNYADSDSADSITYGWHLASANRIENGKTTVLPRFMLADKTSNAMLIFSDDFYLGDGHKIGWPQIPQIPLLSLNEQSTIETKEYIYVGKHNDVSSITDQLWQTGPVVSGQVNEKNTGIHVYSLDRTPVTFVRTNTQGKFSFRLPTDAQSQYTLVVRASANREVRRNISITSQNLPLSTIKLPPASKVLLPKGDAMRLLFIGINGTHQPDFDDQLTKFSVSDDNGSHKTKPVSNIFLAGKESDVTEVDIIAGEYRVYATRGPEFSLEKTDIVVNPNSVQKLIINTPRRILSTPDFIASDLHVHSGLSFDNAFSEIQRVRSFVAEHGEVMVSSEHDLPVDYAPRITELGVENLIVSIPAAEVTSLLPSKLNPFSNGHANFFPYKANKHAYRRGMVNHEDKRWRDVMNTIRQEQPGVIVQMNHPRHNMALSGKSLPKNWQEMIDNGQFLDHMGSAGHPYNPHEPLIWSRN